MDTIIDLGCELLVDRSQLPAGAIHLMLKAIGHPLVTGSPWMVINKNVAQGYKPLLALLRYRKQAPAA